MRLSALVLLAASLVRAQEEAASPAKLLAEADAAFARRQYDEARPAYERAVDSARVSGDRSTETEALAQVARMYSATGRLEEGKPWLARAKAVASPEQPLGWTRYLGVRGIFEREAGEKGKALATFEEMYRYALEKKLPRRAIDATHHAAIVAPPEDQVAWAKKGIAAAEAAGDEGWLAVLWNNLGATYDWDLKDYDKAVECYEKARTYHYRTGGEPQKLAADWALGKALVATGKPQNLEKAEPLLTAARAKARERHEAKPTKDTLEWVGNTEWAYGDLRVAQGARGEGRTHLQAARKALVEAGIEEWWPDGLKDLDARITALTPDR